MDIRSLYAAQRYAATLPAMTPQPGTGTGTVKETFAAAAEEFQQTLLQAETNASTAMTGDADPHALVQALAQSELAVETVVTLRNKVVEAYQEILRMPV
ncbi:flagellar hook-basal body complex protein FliE [Salipiger marinus]|uniref:Flagellar hook-basal body complex protein FliE n=1 Tax=Salipiger marinus TaxID=555512 RepID=A0A1G8UMI1_9RHOB|nr:flagellar hook-basal body complex protein FliE [Salipiger marinus]SDJ54697.1 flagellar hook-basal body complex protein FliE [Salipiger marinus]